MPISIILSVLLLFSPLSQAELPSIGNANSSVLQLDEEYRLGQVWVRELRARAQLLDDPVVESYLRGLLWQLAPHSELQDQRLSLVIIDSAEINAFAAPGGIIGIHAGLLQAAEHEDELASVLAHELAHLSQRHFAQQQAAANQNAPLVMAGVLGGILLSSVNAEAGMALYQGTIGASVSSRLAFSRAHEKDADQTGMKTLARAGFSADAIPRMFTRLSQANRFTGNELPEFLRTHPVTEDRIAEATDRAQQFVSSAVRVDSPEFRIAKARVMAHLFSAKQRTASPQTQDLLLDYQLAIKSGQSSRANSLWEKLNSQLKESAWLQLSRVRQLSSEDPAAAEQLLEALTELYPDDYAVRRAQLDNLMNQQRHADAFWLLRDLVREYPDNIQLWYQLAEVAGLNGENTWVHRARVEYFLLRADYDLALRQLEFARRDARRQPEQLEWIAQREIEVKQLRAEVDRYFR